MITHDNYWLHLEILAKLMHEHTRGQSGDLLPKWDLLDETDRAKSIEIAKKYVIDLAAVIKGN